MQKRDSQTVRRTFEHFTNGLRHGQRGRLQHLFDVLERHQSPREIAGLVTLKLLAQITEFVVIRRQLNVLGTGLSMQALSQRQLTVGDQLDLRIDER